MFCKKSGAEVASTYKLCPQCGEKDFSHSRATTASQAVKPQSPAPQTIPQITSKQTSQNKLILAAVFSVIVIVIALLGIKTWENAKAEAEVKKQEEFARIELERKRKEMELELERKRLEEEAARSQARAQLAEQEAKEKARLAEQGARESQDRRDRIASTRDAIGALEFYARPSLMQEGTKVLQIHNIRGVSISFDLKCCTTNNACRTMAVSIEPRGTTDIGFLEGWPGNFVSGESCEIRYQDEIMRSVRIK